MGDMRFHDAYRRIGVSLLFLVCVFLPGIACASNGFLWYLTPNSVSADYGSGKGMQITGVKIRSRDWITYNWGPWRGHSALEAGVAQWDGGGAFGRGNSRIIDVGITPVFRIERPVGGVTPFAEVGIGVHVLDHTSITRRNSENLDVSTSFQFGEHLGGGLLVGARRQFGVGVYAYHESNGSVKKPNPGVTGFRISAAYMFE